MVDYTAFHLYPDLIVPTCLCFNERILSVNPAHTLHPQQLPGHFQKEFKIFIFSKRAD